MRRTAIGIGATAGISAVPAQSVAAQDGSTWETVKTVAGVAISPPLAGAYYLSQRYQDSATGDEVSKELDDLNAQETYTSVRSDAVEMNSVDDRVLTSIQNLIEGIDRRAYQKGIETAIERLNEGDSQADVKTKAVDAAMATITTTQKNLIDHFGIQAAKTNRLATELNKNGTSEDMPLWVDGSQAVTGGDDPLYVYGGTDTGTTDANLADGSTYTYQQLGVMYPNSSNSPGRVYGIQASPMVDFDIVKVNPYDTGEQKELFPYAQYRSIFSTTESTADTVTTEIQTWVDNIYSSYSAGDISLSEVVTSDQLAATASEQNDLSNVTADLAVLGQPLNDKTTLTIEIVTGDRAGTVVDGNLSVSNPPDGGFVVGDTYDPATISGPVFLIFDNDSDGDGTKEGDVAEIQGQFKVIDAEDYNGEPVTSVTFSERTQKRYSTDVQQLKEELDRLAQLQQEIQEERDSLIEEESGGGGGGFLADSDQNWGLIAAAAGVAAIGWGYVTGDDQ